MRLDDGREIIVPVYSYYGSAVRIYIHYGRINGYIGKKVNVEKGLVVLEKLIRGHKGIDRLSFLPVLDWPRTVYLFGRKRIITNNFQKKDDERYFFLSPDQKFADVYDQRCEDFAKSHLLKEAEKGGIDLGGKIIVRIDNYRSKHASYRASDHLFEFDRRLFAYVPSVIDSTIDHELSHVKHMNHDQNFYKQLFTLCPKKRYYECKRIIDEGRFEDEPAENY